MDLLTYINSYTVCCINHVPEEKINEWRQLYPELEIPVPHRHEHIRFYRGKYISFYDAPYKVGETYLGGTVECVLTYEELSAEIDDVDIEFNGIL